MAIDLIRDAIEQYTDTPRDRVVPEAKLSELNVDSLSLAEMMFMLEDKLNVTIVEPTERPQTVADLMALLKPHLNELTG